jgi:diphosphomevalonate decarboxylase
MFKNVPNTIVNQLKNDYEEILNYLIKKEYNIQELPIKREKITEYGEAYSLAYPIQGVLKYHGILNKTNRIAYFPSISFNNNSAFTVTYLKFDKELKSDLAYLNGIQLSNENLKRIIISLNAIRDYSKIKSKAIVISRNFSKSPGISNLGKGLGTSASGSAALALGAISIIYNNDPEYISNKRLISIFSRYLAGSGTRSAAGGFAIWLNYPTINSFDSFAIRLDREEHRKLINKLSFITISINSDLKTERAHEIAVKSPFFLSWLKERKSKIFDFFEALDNCDLNKIGELAEYDTMCLHSVTMTAPQEQNIIAWKPDTLAIMLRVRELRASGNNVYFSIDTGPSVVLLTYKKETNNIINAIEEINQDLEIIKGDLGGPSKLLNSNSNSAQLLKEDLKKFNII